MKTLQEWIDSTLAEHDRKEAEEKANLEAQKRAIVDARIEGICQIVASWGVPLRPANFDTAGNWILRDRNNCTCVLALSGNRLNIRTTDRFFETAEQFALLLRELSDVDADPFTDEE